MNFFGEAVRRRMSAVLRPLALAAAALLLLEVLLQLGGFFRGVLPAGGRRERVVLLVGDAWALGPGGRDFPARLRALLRAGEGGGDIRVESRLRPGGDTASLAERFEGDLRAVSPESAVAFVGGQDSWASVRPETAGRGGPGGLFLGGFLERSRLFRIGRVLWWRLRYGSFRPYGDRVSGDMGAAAEAVALAADRLRRGPGAPEPDGVSGATSEFEAVYDEAQELERGEEYARARARYARLRELWPTHPAGFLGEAICHMKQGRIEPAVSLLEKAVRLPPVPELIEVYSQLGWAHERKGDFAAAVRWWEEGLIRFPESRSLFEALAKGHQSRGDIWKALEAAGRSPGLRANPRYRLLDYLASASGKGDIRELMARSLREDLRLLCSAARRRRVRLVVASYPDPAVDMAALAAEGGALHLDLGGSSKGGRVDLGAVESVLAGLLSGKEGTTRGR